MVGVCRFWQQGNCRNGNSCRFLHSNGNNRDSTVNNNRFAALQTQENSSNNVRNGFHNRSGGNISGNQPAQTQKPAAPYQIDKAAIITDLSTERPQWILSAYGPGRAAPAQLFGGSQREKSFEEMRLYHYQAMAAGAAPQAIQEADNLYQQSEQQIQTILNNVDSAIQFMIDAEKAHPNRLDIVKQSASTGQPLTSFNNLSAHTQANSNTVGGQAEQTQSSFGASSSRRGAFGQPSTLGPQPGAFETLSRPAFGQLSQPSGTPAFGQPAFGQPSQSAGTPAFGQPSQPAGASAFGKPAFGASSQSTRAYGAPLDLGQKANPFGGSSGAGAFGAPSAFGQKPSLFGAPSVSSAPTGSPFDEQRANPNPFAAQAATSTGGFGTPSEPNPFLGTPKSTSNPFGIPSEQQTPTVGRPGLAFGAPSPAQNPFSKSATSGFGVTSQTTPANPFAKAQQQSNGDSLTAGPVPQASIANGFAATGQPPLPLPPTAAGLGTSKILVNSHPPLESYSTRGLNGQLVMFKGKRVEYRNEVPGVLGRDGVWSKIWFPDGPFVRKNNDTQMDDVAYDQSTRAAYEHLRQTGTFANAIMPLVPPRADWVTYEF